MLFRDIARNFESPGVFLDGLKKYLGISRTRTEIGTATQLAEFLGTRASHVAQSALYGYLRTRAGTRYPELFANDAFLFSINIAKWQVWLACLSDLSVYSGGRITSLTGAAPEQIGSLTLAAARMVLDETGEPQEAGADFAAAANRVIERITATAWTNIGDDDSCFTESPAALVRFAPVVDSFKVLDNEIVMNSVRYRWQEIRREFRNSLDAPALLETLTDP